MTGLSVSVLQAEKGDCCLLQTTQENILIDGGPETFDPVYEKNKNFLPKIIHYVIVTHIDDDHIGGVIKLLLDCAALPIKNDHQRYVGALIFNFPQTSEKLLNSARQGSRLLAIAHARNIPILPAYPGITAPPLTDYALSYLGPSALNRQKFAAMLAGSYRGQAESVTINRQSIIMQIQSQQHAAVRLLMTGDAFDKLRQDRDLNHAKINVWQTDIRGNQNPSNFAEYLFLKVPHHASNHSQDSHFYQAVFAKYYLIQAKDSPSGEKPTWQVLQWIVLANLLLKRENYFIYLTNYNDQVLQLLKNPHLNPQAGHYQIFVLKPEQRIMTFQIQETEVHKPSSEVVQELNYLPELAAQFYSYRLAQHATFFTKPTPSPGIAEGRTVSINNPSLR